MGAQSFTELVCWQLSNELSREILAITARAPACADFWFCRQIRNSSASACGNIAEGFGRFQPGEFANFLRYAKASLVETRAHLITARDRKYLDDRLYSKVSNLARAAENTTTALLVQQLRKAREQKRE